MQALSDTCHAFISFDGIMMFAWMRSGAAPRSTAKRATVHAD